MTRGKATLKERARYINIGFIEPNFLTEVKTFKEKIIVDNTAYRFVCDYEMPEVLTKYGRWVIDA